MNRIRTSLLALVVFPVGIGLAAEGPSPKAAFERLKGLAGRWEGNVESPGGPASAVEYRVTAAGTLVTEVQFPGTEYEMVSLFYLDGADLRAKHFCAMGNQPEMKFDPAASSETDFHFAFTGGTNMDPAKDAHVHGGTISFRGEQLENEWSVYSGGKPGGANRFFLSRAKD